jgi:hypothetical protein
MFAPEVAICAKYGADRVPLINAPVAINLAPDAIDCIYPTISDWTLQSIIAFLERLSPHVELLKGILSDSVPLITGALSLLHLVESKISDPPPYSLL